MLNSPKESNINVHIAQVPRGHGFPAAFHSHWLIFLFSQASWSSMANHGISRHEMPCFKVQWSFLSKFDPTGMVRKDDQHKLLYFIAVITFWKVTKKTGCHISPKHEMSRLKFALSRWNFWENPGQWRSTKVNFSLKTPRHGPSSRIARGCWVEMFVIELDGTKGWTCPVQLVFFFLTAPLVVFLYFFGSVFEFADVFIFLKFATESS